MNEFEKEVALQKILAREEKEMISKRRDRLHFLTCASCLVAVAVLPKGIHNLPLMLVALISWLFYVEALEIPKNWSEDSDLRWHFFQGHKILENAFQKDKGWKTLILMMGFVMLRITMK